MTPSKHDPAVNDMRWSFDEDQTGGWHWNAATSTRMVVVRSAAKFRTRAEAVADATTFGYRGKDGSAK